MKKFTNGKKLILIGVLLLAMLSSVIAVLVLGNSAKAESLFTLNERDVLMEVGDSKKLELELEDTTINESELTVTWKSSKSSVATVDKDGTVKAVVGGETKVTAVVEYKGKEYSTKCMVTVKADGNEYSTYKVRWYTQKQDRTGYDIKEETFERLVGSTAEMTVQDAKKQLPANYTFNKEKSILTGTVKEALGACVLEVYFDVAEITYFVDYYYESDTELGTYNTVETKKYTTWAFSEVKVTEKPKTGFVINEAVKGTVKSNASVVAGSKLKVFCDRIRSKVTFTYISGKASATYDNIYGIGLINAPEDVFTDVAEYKLATYVNGKKKDATFELMKTLTADTEVAVKLDGKGFDYTIANGVSTITNNNTAKKTPSFAVLNGASNTIYLSATYKTTGSSSNRFGITLSDGKTTRQIRFAGTGITVMKSNTTSGGIASANNATNTYANAGVYNDGDVYVWARNTKTYNSTKVSSVISDMMRNASGGSYDIHWAVLDNVLYASINGETVLRLPLKYLDSSWTGNKKYQIGFSAYDENAWGDALQISNVNLKLGNAAKALLVAEESFDSTLSYRMGYDALTGAYMPSSNAEAAYMYGKETSEDTGISAKIEWINIDNACSAVGVSMKVGEESIQYVVEGENSSYRSMKNHTWAGINKIGTQILKEGTPVSTEGKAEVTAFVKGDYFYIMYNDVQVQCINMLSLFPEYTRDTEVSLGICTWDARYGLSKFSDVKELSASEVSQVANAKEWGFYSESLTVDDYSFQDASASKSATGRKRVYLHGSNETWQIEGRYSRLDDTNADLLVGFEISSGEDTIMILAHNNGFRKIVNENWSDPNLSSNCNNVNYKSTLYAFNNIVTTKLFNSNGSDTRTQTYIDYKAVLYNDTLYVWFKDEAGNEGLCWRVPLTEEEFGAFEKGSVYDVSLYFAESDTDASMTNVDVKMGYQVTEQTDFVADNKGQSYDFCDAIEVIDANIERWDDNFRQKTISGMMAEELGTGIIGNNAAYAYLKGSSTDVYLSATYDMKANATAKLLGIALTDGTETRAILYNGYGVTLLQDHTNVANEIPAIPTGQSYHYYNTAIRPGYVWVYQGTTNTVSKMLSSQTAAHEHEVKWAITDGVLYGMVDDFVFLRMPVEKLCATWDENTKLQIGFEQFFPNNNGDPKTIKNIEVSFGEDAVAKMVKDKTVETTESAGMTYEVFNGTYLPNSAAGSKYMYGEATNESQVMKATITQIDKANSTFGCGISVKTVRTGEDVNEQSAQIVGYGKVDKVRLIKNHGYSFMFPLRDTVTPISTQWIEKPIFDENGICDVTAVVKNYTLYVFYNGELAGSVDLYKVLPDYKEGDNVQLGIFGISPLEGLATFSDISFAKGEEAVKDITLNDNKEWEIFTNIEGVINTESKVNNVVKMTGNGKTHVATPTSGQSECSVIYGVATEMSQMLTADLKLADSSIETYANGVSIECNGKSIEFYAMSNSKKYIRIQPNKTWSNSGTSPVYYDFADTNAKIYDENGVCNITAIVKDGMFYLKLGNSIAYKARLDVIFPGYDGSEIRLGVCTWDSKNGVSEFENVNFQAGAVVSAVDVSAVAYKDIKFVAYKENLNSQFTINNSGDVIRTGNTSAKRAYMLLDGESTVWEVTGTMKRTDINYGVKLFAGFAIQQGDQKLAVKACQNGVYFDRENSTYNFNSGVKETKNAFVKNLLTTKMFWDQWKADSDPDVTFKAIIYKDVLYVWIDDVPSWIVPLTEKVPTTGNAELVKFTPNQPYSFGFAAHEHNSSVKYENLRIKTTDTDGSIKAAVDAFNEAIK